MNGYSRKIMHLHLFNKEYRKNGKEFTGSCKVEKYDGKTRVKITTDHLQLPYYKEYDVGVLIKKDNKLHYRYMKSIKDIYKDRYKDDFVCNEFIYDEVEGLIIKKNNDIIVATINQEEVKNKLIFDVEKVEDLQIGGKYEENFKEKKEADISVEETKRNLKKESEIKISREIEDSKGRIKDDYMTIEEKKVMVNEELGLEEYTEKIREKDVEIIVKNIKEDKEITAENIKEDKEITAENIKEGKDSSIKQKTDNNDIRVKETEVTEKKELKQKIKTEIDIEDYTKDVNKRNYDINTEEINEKDFDLNTKEIKMTSNKELELDEEVKLKEFVQNIDALFKQHPVINPFGKDFPFECIKLNIMDLIFLPIFTNKIKTNPYIIHSNVVHKHVLLIRDIHTGNIMVGVADFQDQFYSQIGSLYGLEYFIPCEHNHLEGFSYGYWLIGVNIN